MSRAAPAPLPASPTTHSRDGSYVRPVLPVVTTIAGSGRRGAANGARLHEAYVDQPCEMCLMPDGSVIVADGRNNSLRRLELAPDGELSTVQAHAFLGPRAPVPIDGGSAVIVCDSGHNKVRMVQFSPSDGRTVLLDCAIAGSGRQGHQDGPAEHAMFSRPSGMCVIGDGSLLVSDSGNHCIRRISGRAGETGLFVSTVMGAPGGGGFADGELGAGLLSCPSALAVAADGTVLVADTGNNAIRALHPPLPSAAGNAGGAAGVINYASGAWLLTTIAGGPGGGTGFRDGDCGAAAALREPAGLCLLPSASVLCEEDGAAGQSEVALFTDASNAVRALVGSSAPFSDPPGGPKSSHAIMFAVDDPSGTPSRVSLNSPPPGAPGQHFVLLLRTPGEAGRSGEEEAPGARPSGRFTLLVPTGLLAHDPIAPAEGAERGMPAAAASLLAAAAAAGQQRAWSAQHSSSGTSGGSSIPPPGSWGPRMLHLLSCLQAAAVQPRAQVQVPPGVVDSGSPWVSVVPVDLRRLRAVQGVHARFSHVCTVAGPSPRHIAAAAARALAVSGVQPPLSEQQRHPLFAKHRSVNGAPGRWGRRGSSNSAGGGSDTGGSADSARGGGGSAQQRAELAALAAEMRYADGRAPSARFLRPTGLLPIPFLHHCVAVSDSDNNFVRLLVTGGAAAAFEAGGATATPFSSYLRGLVPLPLLRTAADDTAAFLGAGTDGQGGFAASPAASSSSDCDDGTSAPGRGAAAPSAPLTPAAAAAAALMLQMRKRRNSSVSEAGGGAAPGPAAPDRVALLLGSGSASDASPAPPLPRLKQPAAPPAPPTVEPGREQQGGVGARPASAAPRPPAAPFTGVIPPPFTRRASKGVANAPPPRLPIGRHHSTDGSSVSGGSGARGGTSANTSLETPSAPPLHDAPAAPLPLPQPAAAVDTMDVTLHPTPRLAAPAPDAAPGLGAMTLEQLAADESAIDGFGEPGIGGEEVGYDEFFEAPLRDPTVAVTGPHSLPDSHASQQRYYVSSSSVSGAPSVGHSAGASSLLQQQRQREELALQEQFRLFQYENVTRGAAAPRHPSQPPSASTSSLFGGASFFAGGSLPPLPGPPGGRGAASYPLPPLAAASGGGAPIPGGGLLAQRDQFLRASAAAAAEVASRSGGSREDLVGPPGSPAYHFVDPRKAAAAVLRRGTARGGQPSQARATPAAASGSGGVSPVGASSATTDPSARLPLPYGGDHLRADAVGGGGSDAWGARRGATAPQHPDSLLRVQWAAEGGAGSHGGSNHFKSSSNGTHNRTHSAASPSAAAPGSALATAQEAAEEEKAMRSSLGASLSRPPAHHLGTTSSPPRESAGEAAHHQPRSSSTPRSSVLNSSRRDREQQLRSSLGAPLPPAGAGSGGGVMVSPERGRVVLYEWSDSRDRIAAAESAPDAAALRELLLQAPAPRTQHAGTTTASPKLLTARYARHTEASGSHLRARGLPVVRSAPAFMNVQQVLHRAGGGGAAAEAGAATATQARGHSSSSAAPQRAPSRGRGTAAPGADDRALQRHQERSEAPGRRARAGPPAETLVIPPSRVASAASDGPTEYDERTSSLRNSGGAGSPFNDMIFREYAAAFQAPALQQQRPRRSGAPPASALLPAATADDGHRDADPEGLIAFVAANASPGSASELRRALQGLSLDGDDGDHHAPPLPSSGAHGGKASSAPRIRSPLPFLPASAPVSAGSLSPGVPWRGAVQAAALAAAAEVPLRAAGALAARSGRPPSGVALAVEEAGDIDLDVVSAVQLYHPSFARKKAAVVGGPAGRRTTGRV